MKKFWPVVRRRIRRPRGSRFARVHLFVQSAVSYRALRRWRSRLGLCDYRIRCEATNPLQVTGPDGRAGHDLVGVVVEDKLATIVHTRPLREDDIIHELLHVARSEWPHSLVELWTELLMAEPNFSVLIRKGDTLDGALAGELMSALTQPHPPRSFSPRKEISEMKEVTAYNLKTERQVNMLNPELVTLKNGRKALRGVASDDGKTTVVKILGAKALAEWEKA